MTMAHSFPPAPGRPDDPAGAERHAQNAPQMAPRSTPRPPLRSVLPRLIMLAVTLVLLIGVFALVHGNLVSAPVRSDAAKAGAQTTGASTTGLSQGAPDFTLTTLGGGSFHLAAQRGHVVVLYFMATACGSCAQGSHDLAQALLSAKTAGAEAVAIDVTSVDSTADLQEFIQAVGVPATAPIRWGIDVTGTIANAYGVPALETTVVIDKQGQIAYRQDGSVPPEQLAQIVRNLA